MVKVSADGEGLSRWLNTQQDGQVYENEVWSKMGPYGSTGAHIKTGRSHIAQNHFQTPLDPKKCKTNRVNQRNRVVKDTMSG